MEIPVAQIRNPEEFEAVALEAMRSKAAQDRREVMADTLAYSGEGEFYGCPSMCWVADTVPIGGGL